MTPDFDRVASIYRALEYLSFGRALEHARFTGLHRLAGCRDILVLGEGDGRCLAQLLRVAPAARVHCVDASAAMIARARARVADRDLPRVTFEQADARVVELPIGHYDAVVTCFFLDCLSPAEVEALIQRIAPSLRPGARWLFADFAVPAHGWRRVIFQPIVRGLYLFFKWRTGLKVTRLPPSEALLEQHGWRTVNQREFRRGLIRQVVLERTCSPVR